MVALNSIRPDRRSDGERALDDIGALHERCHTALCRVPWLALPPAGYRTVAAAEQHLRFAVELLKSIAQERRT